jgi:hypothetical protein
MMRKFRFVGSEKDAVGYSMSTHRRPKVGEIYTEDTQIGSESVSHWVKQALIEKEWEEIFEEQSNLLFSGSSPDTSSENDCVYSPNFDENVNVHINPRHYKNGKVECIDAIESAVVGKVGIEATCVSNIIKYLWRYEDKNGIIDVKKAKWYLDKLINVIEERNNES